MHTATCRFQANVCTHPMIVSGRLCTYLLHDTVKTCLRIMEYEVAEKEMVLRELKEANERGEELRRAFEKHSPVKEMTEFYEEDERG